MKTDEQILSELSATDERKLVSWSGSSSQPVKNNNWVRKGGDSTVLEDGDDGKVFDQFKGKKTTYREDIYTSKLQEDRITEE